MAPNVCPKVAQTLFTVEFKWCNSKAYVCIRNVLLAVKPLWVLPSTHWSQWLLLITVSDWTLGSYMWGHNTKGSGVSQGVRLKPGVSGQYSCHILRCGCLSSSESTTQVGKQIVRLVSVKADILPCSGKAFPPWFRSTRGEGPSNVALSSWILSVSSWLSLS